jgi:glyoxylase-like metal-dependent hydrolase (beta-lactamase superfamily II)
LNRVAAIAGNGKGRNTSRPQGGAEQGGRMMEFSTAFEARHGEAVPAAAGLAVFRVTANNPGPFTFHGTNAYVLGETRLVVIDPGPDDAGQLEALRACVAGRPVEAILVTHTHADHSPLARALALETGASIIGCRPHEAFRPLAFGETNLLDASGDRAHRPDRELADGDAVETELGPLRAIATPGHTANHLCFALDDHGIVFSGDHVMAWSTSIIAPPDGAMGPYMASLDRLIDRGDRILLPGHGGPVTEPARFMRGLRSHRRMRANAILERLKAGDRTIAEMVPVLYSGVDKRLHGAAALSVFAHVEEWIEKGVVAAEGHPTPSARFSLI